MKEPMLCRYARIEDLPDGPLFLQPKLNGIRAWYDVASRTLRTRAGWPISACPRVQDECERIGIPLDGELYLHGTCLADIAGAASRLRPSDLSAALTFNVFDVWDSRPQSERIEAVARINTPTVKAIETVRGTRREAQILYAGWLAAGYEGLIAREEQAEYTPGRRTLWKCKPIWD